MGLLQKLKSALGLDGAQSSGSGGSGEVDVTVEREPSTADEDAVKGTETASSDDTGSAAAGDAGESDDSDTTAEEAADEDTAEEAADEDTAEEAADEDTAEETADEDTAEETADEESEGDTTGAAAGSTDPVTELNGIGPAYADRLAGIDIETVGELAEADAAEVAEAISVGESRVADWVDQAQSY